MGRMAGMRLLGSMRLVISQAKFTPITALENEVIRRHCRSCRGSRRDRQTWNPCATVTSMNGPKSPIELGMTQTPWSDGGFSAHFISCGCHRRADAIERKLHLLARRLILPHPRGGTLDVTAPLPPHMRQTFDVFG